MDEMIPSYDKNIQKFILLGDDLPLNIWHELMISSHNDFFQEVHIIVKVLLEYKKKSE